MSCITRIWCFFVGHKFTLRSTGMYRNRVFVEPRWCAVCGKKTWWTDAGMIAKLLPASPSVTDATEEGKP